MWCQKAREIIQWANMHCHRSEGDIHSPPAYCWMETTSKHFALQKRVGLKKKKKWKGRDICLFDSNYLFLLLQCFLFWWYWHCFRTCCFTWTSQLHLWFEGFHIHSKASSGRQCKSTAAPSALQTWATCLRKQTLLQRHQAMLEVHPHQFLQFPFSVNTQPCFYQAAGW